MLRRKPHPCSAAERRQSVAPGVSPAVVVPFAISPAGAKESQKSVAPPALILTVLTDPGLTPGATLCRRSAALMGVPDENRGHRYRRECAASAHLRSNAERDL